jgi:hypothetical protein
VTDLPLPSAIREKFASGELTTEGALDIEPPEDVRPESEPVAPVEEEPPVDVTHSLFRCRVCHCPVDGEQRGPHEPDCIYADTRSFTADPPSDPHATAAIPAAEWDAIARRVAELKATAHSRPQERIWNPEFLTVGLVGEWHFAQLLGVTFNIGKLYDGGCDFGQIDVKSVPYFDHPLLNRLAADKFRAAYYALCAVDLNKRLVRYVGWATKDELLAAPDFDYRFGSTHTLGEEALRRGLPPTSTTKE